MLNPFPELLTWGLAAAFILRLLVGLSFGVYAIKLGVAIGTGKLAAQKTLEILWALCFVTFAVGVFLTIGLYTQIAAIAAAILLAAAVVAQDRAKTLLPRDRVYYLSLLIVALVLLVTGAGFFAFDLPL
ncbi:MAG: hypothetical protein Q8R25_03705 [bacterium]|nr:hypothetical protein [bacterium]